MALYRNVTAVPLDDLPGGTQLLTQCEVDLTDDDLARPGVATHLAQGTLVPVTMTTTAAPRGKSAR